jgi:DNA repair exonuclease SbcCD nuclease subunit
MATSTWSQTLVAGAEWQGAIIPGIRWYAGDTLPDMLTFLHTSDWQLGMTRAWFDTESQARYTDDQFAGLRTIALLADERGCGFVVVAGDVFDSIQPDRRIIVRTIEALKEFKVPVYLVPGNHDVDSPGALWTTSDITTTLPELVRVVRLSDVISVPGVNAEVVGVPWPSKRPDRDLVAEVLSRLTPTQSGVARIMVGHGQIESFDPNRDNLAMIRLALIEQGITNGLLSYLALGDRHSGAAVGGTGAIWYSGAPLMTDFDEQLTSTNQVLVVTVDGNQIEVDAVRVGRWQFLREEVSASGEELVDRVEALVSEHGDKERTAIRLSLEGTVNLEQRAHLDDVLDRARDLFASITVSEGRSDLAVLVDDDDLEKLNLSGFARATLDELRDASEGSGREADVAADALRLLYRLAVRS